MFPWRLSLFGTIVTKKHGVSILPIFLLCSANKDSAGKNNEGRRQHTEAELMLCGAKTLEKGLVLQHSPYIWKLFDQYSNLHLDGRGVLEQNDVSHVTDHTV